MRRQTLFFEEETGVELSMVDSRNQDGSVRAAIGELHRSVSPAIVGLVWASRDPGRYSADLAKYNPE